MNFHEARFPTDISLGSTGGPERRTDVVEFGSGHEERNIRWADSRRSYQAGYGIKTVDQLYAVLEFFEERRGRGYGFRWLDGADYRSRRPRDPVEATDQLIGTGDGEQTAFQLAKVYGAAHAPWTRTITKPVSGTVLVALDGIQQGAGWSVDETTGVVTFDVAPGSGVAVSAGFEFDVPVRFDVDRIEVNLHTLDHGDIPNIPIVEVRL
jgi:uncharacterized protein (TIGR02217 family)